MSQLDSHGTFLLFSLQTTAPFLSISSFEYLLLPPRSALKAVPLKSYRSVYLNPFKPQLPFTVISTKVDQPSISLKFSFT